MSIHNKARKIFIFCEISRLSKSCIFVPVYGKTGNMAVIRHVLDRNSSLPLYAQLKTIIKDKVENGEWRSNEMIPSENELASSYGISRMTARSVVTQLVTEGILYRVQGKGTFVCEDKIEMASPSYAGIRSQLEK
jgi:GntR family transcriptional regulator